MMRKYGKEIANHLIFWAGYILLWSIRDLVYHPNLWQNIVPNAAFNIVVAPFVYLNIYFLVPRYLLKKKWGFYACFLLLGFVLAFFARHYTFQLIFRHWLGIIDVADAFDQGSGYVVTVSENIILFVVTMAIFLIRQWYVKEKYAKELEQKNIETELNMLKSQLQPHFLFNNLNTIYFMMEKKPEQAKEVMLQFTDVLSHQLYNAKKDLVPVSEELDSIESFIKLQMVRHEDFLTLSYSLPQEVGNLQIAPMILLTFVENAFKHSQREDGYFVDINICLDGDELSMVISNTVGLSNDEQKGGVGLKNVKRRLALIYPESHDLSIRSSDERYCVELKMTLSDHG